MLNAIPIATGENTHKATMQFGICAKYLSPSCFSELSLLKDQSTKVMLDAHT